MHLSMSNAKICEGKRYYTLKLPNQWTWDHFFDSLVEFALLKIKTNKKMKEERFVFDVVIFQDDLNHTDRLQILTNTI